MITYLVWTQLLILTAASRNPWKCHDVRQYCLVKFKPPVVDLEYKMERIAEKLLYSSSKNPKMMYVIGIYIENGTRVLIIQDIQMVDHENLLLEQGMKDDAIARGCRSISKTSSEEWEDNKRLTLMIGLCQSISDFQLSATILQEINFWSSVSCVRVISYIDESHVLSDIEDLVNELENSTASKSNQVGVNLIQSLTKLTDNCINDINNGTRESIRSNIEKLCADMSLTNDRFEFRSQQVAGLTLAGKRVVGKQHLRFRIHMTPHDQIGLLEETNVVDEIPKHRNYTKDVIDLPMTSIIGNLSISDKDSLDRLIVIAYENDKLFWSASEVKIVTKVMYVHIPGLSVHDLEEDINLTLAHEEGNSSQGRLLCVYYEFGSWDQHGCRVLEAGQDFVTCGCNHLSSFSLMMSVDHIEAYNESQELMSIVGCVISIFSLFVTLLTYWMFPFLRSDIPSKILICLCSSLLMANMAYVANAYIGYANTGQEAAWLCKSVAMLLHYSMLSALVWMACDAYYLYVAMTKVFIVNIECLMLKFQIVGWGFPLLAVLVTSIYKSLDNYDIDKSNFCWIKQPVAYYVFVAPAGLIMTFNLVVFVIVLYFLQKTSRTQCSSEMKKEIFTQLKGAVSLFSLLGLTWFFGFLAIWLSPVVFSYLFVIFNTLQGFFIFVFYCFLKPNVSYFWNRCLRNSLPSKEMIVQSKTGGLNEMEKPTTTYL